MIPLLPIYLAALVILTVLYGPNGLLTLSGPETPVGTIGGSQIAAVKTYGSEISSFVGRIVSFLSAGMVSAEKASEKVADLIFFRVEDVISNAISSVSESEPAAAAAEEAAKATEYQLPYVSKAVEYASDAAAKLHSTWTDVASREPVKGYLAAAAKLYQEHLQLYVDAATDYYFANVHFHLKSFFKPAIDDLKDMYHSLLTGDNTAPGPVLYVMVVVMLFFCILFVTKVCKLFLKDVFWLNQGVSSMYGPTSRLSAAVGGERGESYDEMKVDTPLVVDEIAELEKTIAMEAKKTPAKSAKKGKKKSARRG